MKNPGILNLGWVKSVKIRKNANNFKKTGRTDYFQSKVKKSPLKMKKTWNFFLPE